MADGVLVALLVVGDVGEFHPQLGPASLAARRFEQRALCRSRVAGGALAPRLIQPGEEPLIAKTLSHRDALRVPLDRLAPASGVLVCVGEIKDAARRRCQRAFFAEYAQVARVGAFAGAG